MLALTACSLCAASWLLQVNFVFDLHKTPEKLRQLTQHTAVLGSWGCDGKPMHFTPPPRHCWVKRYQGTNWPAPSLGSSATTYNKTKAEYRQGHLGDFCLGSLWDSECATPYAIKASVSLSSCLDVPQPPGEQGAHGFNYTAAPFNSSTLSFYTAFDLQAQSRGDKS